MVACGRGEAKDAAGFGNRDVGNVAQDDDGEIVDGVDTSADEMRQELRVIKAEIRGEQRQEHVDRGGWG